MPSIFHLHPAITYCSQKNTVVLLISALTPLAVTPEPRTDSKPFRRRFARKTGFGSCRRKYLQNYLRQSFESRSQDGVPRAFYVTFCTPQKVTTRSLCREHRGSANLDSARRNGGFAQTQLNPLPLRGLFPPYGGAFAASPLSRRLCRLCNFPVSLKHGRLAHVRSQFSLFRRSPTHKNLPLATFCTSERHFPGGKAAFLGLGGCRKRGIIADLFTKLCRNNPANRLTHA